ISPTDVPAFVDCVMDGFSRLNLALTTASSKQTKRTDGYRVETYSNNRLIVSADVLNSGNVELFEQKAAHGLFDVWSTNGELTTFDRCLKKYQHDKS
ncbi:MAG: hypothetical protein ABL919_15305, partial [Methylococcales bacterium]